MTEEHNSLEAALDQLERRVGNAIDSTARSLAMLKRAQKAAASGDLATLKRSLADQKELSRAAQADGARVSDSWPYSDDEERKLFESGRLMQEILQAVEARGLAASLEDGQLMCYPVIVRALPARRAVLVDRELVRQVRPGVLAGELALIQRKPAKLKPARFLEALHTAWEYARHLDAAGRLPATDVRVDDVYAAMTVSPAGTEYSRQEFGRDLYLLEQSDVRETRKGQHVRFSRSTGTKERGAIVVVGEDGRRVTYSSIGFTG